RSMKAQMKYANRKGFTFTVAIGDNELESNSAELKNMETGESIKISLDKNIIESVDDVVTQLAMKELEETAEKI
ncbi:MAG TPA: His/Gly/Thr/Pro-type tRNA ligase C-terminal domain-containing protein, partial [Ruminiclostridium sp.]|nr:His/Gly/Thr/Pro-type tRNA ligase C-terminal domain-containing protein [Ruminiclostridium sp.]